MQMIRFLWVRLGLRAALLKAYTFYHDLQNTGTVVWQSENKFGFPTLPNLHCLLEWSQPPQKGAIFPLAARNQTTSGYKLFYRLGSWAVDCSEGSGEQLGFKSIVLQAPGLIWKGM